jgi:hypothetical protein
MQLLILGLPINSFILAAVSFAKQITGFSEAAIALPASSQKYPDKSCSADLLQYERASTQWKAQSSWQQHVQGRLDLRGLLATNLAGDPARSFSVSLWLCCFQEDDLGRQLVAIYGPQKWSVIAEHLPGRIGKQCRERYAAAFALCKVQR